MSPRDTLEFLALAALWGASFLFMRIAAPELGPVPLMLLRCAIGAATLLPVLLYHGKGRELLANAGPLLLLGALNSALPFVLLGYATLTLTAGVTSIVNSLAPLWTALIAFLWLGDRLTRLQILGLVLGAVGVAVLVGGGGDTGREAGIAADRAGALARVAPSFAAAIAATACYGLAANFARRSLVGVHPFATATGSQLAASAVLLVPGLLLWPEAAPLATLSAGDPSGATAGATGAVTGSVWLAAIALGVLCTGLAYLLFFRLITNIGATRTIAVTFVIPLFGVGWGAWLLDERIDATSVVGAAVIVLGTALTTGVLGGSGRRTVAR